MDRKIDIINNWNLKRVFSELENGNYKIPKFQRGYVWERSKIVILLNSIYSQYPIGSIFVWEADYKTYQSFIRELVELQLPKEPSSKQVSFILDGQQRVTSLFVALKGKSLNGVDFSSICFNVEKKVFQIPRLKSEKHNVPAYKLFNTSDYGKVLTEYVLHDQENGTNLHENWRNCEQVFSDYPISIIKTMDMDLEEVVDIFERINQGGKRLSLFDLVHASTWSTSFDLREKIKSFNNEDAVKSFGSIENEVFTQSLAINEFGDPKNQYQLKLTAEKCLAIWNKTQESIKKAVDFVRTLGVVHSSFIPYSSFLSVVQYYFFKGNTSITSEHKKLIVNWFWTSTFSQRFSSSSLTKMKEDIEWINSLLNESSTQNIFPVTISTKELLKIRMQTNSVVKNGVLCLMALRRPQDFSNGNIIILDKSNLAKSNSKENHHFFPYSLRDKFGTDVNGINSVLNFALIPASLNRAISNKFPSEYLKSYQLQNPEIIEHLESHFINSDAFTAALEGDFEKFISIRADSILTEINKKVKVGEYEIYENSIHSEDLIEENIEFESEEEES